MKRVEPESLSQREWAILRDLARVRLLTGRHVQRLHLHDGSPLTQARRTRSTLQRMSDTGLVHRLERRIGGVQAGSAGFVYGLAAIGQRLVSGVGPAGGRRLRKPWESSSTFTAHVLAVSELYVQLREAERLGKLELHEFDAEPAGWRFWTGLHGERLCLKPDAFVVLTVGDIEHRIFVELDRATESLTVIRKKAASYIAYFDAGTEQQRFGIFPRVLFVVPDEKRKEHVVGVLAKFDADYWRLFQVVPPEHAVRALTGSQDDVRSEAARP